MLSAAEVRVDNGDEFQFYNTSTDLCFYTTVCPIRHKKIIVRVNKAAVWHDVATDVTFKHWPHSLSLS